MSTDPAPSARRRPAYRKGRPTLTREGIGKAALEVIALEGHAALTMRGLAEHLQVSPRALYNYVADHHEVLLLAITTAQDDWPVPQLEPARWEQSLRAHCRDLRAWYRRYAGLVPLGMSAQLSTEAGAHPSVARHYEALLGFFAAIGLSTQDGFRCYTHTILVVSAFAEFYDSWHDRPPPGVVPDEWSGVAPVVARTATELDAPHVAAASTLPPQQPDDLFESTLDMLIAGITAQRPKT